MPEFQFLYDCEDSPGWISFPLTVQYGKKPGIGNTSLKLSKHNVFVPKVAEKNIQQLVAAALCPNQFQCNQMETVGAFIMNIKRKQQKARSYLHNLCHGDCKLQQACTLLQQNCPPSISLE